MAFDLRGRSAPGQVTGGPEIAGARSHSAGDQGRRAAPVIEEFAGDAAALD
ncbi:hypothetical protein [Sorangium sp. So ce1182]|uniref:hypothetical protein n=1 Tax=Sorangium sp. So ce1182 TaxID=3133334 RepID=UPI003F6410C6